MNSLLDAREQRQAALLDVMRGGPEALVFVSLNIAGRDKWPDGAEALFAWALRLALVACGQSSPAVLSHDALGCYAIVVGTAALELKRRMVSIESADVAARLVDLDVYDASGIQIGRQQLGLAPRNCLLCAEPAVDFMRAKRHPVEEVIARTHELLSNFRA